MIFVNGARIICPLCGVASSVVEHFPGGPPNILRCLVCTVGFVHPMPVSTVLASQYSTDYFAKKYDETTRTRYVNAEAFRQKSQSCLVQIDRLRGGKKGRLLDLGCGRGWFIELARSFGWEIQGLELCSEIAFQTEARLGTTIHKGSLFDVSLDPESVDAVTMFDTIEHLEMPLKALKICRRVLRPGGVLAISTPNLFGIGCRVLGRNAFGVWPEEHIVYFGPSSIKNALRLADFAEVEVSTREIYPENAPALLRLMIGDRGVPSEQVSMSSAGVIELKSRVRGSRVLRRVRSLVNHCFRLIPLGDELLAFAVKA